MSDKNNESQIDFLKKCPLCGSDYLNMRIDRLNLSYIECPFCNLRLIIDGTHCSDADVIQIIKSLIEKWNKRVTE